MMNFFLHKSDHQFFQDLIEVSLGLHVVSFKLISTCLLFVHQVASIVHLYIDNSINAVSYIVNAIGTIL